MTNIVQNQRSNHKQEQIEFKSIVFVICIIAALGGLLFGIGQGFIASSLDTIQKVYSLDVINSEKYASALAHGALLGALSSGLLARLLGRKKSLVIAGLLFTLFSFASSALPSFMVLVICRIGLGFAVGVASFTVPLYLAESTPPNVRGAMGVLFQLMVTIGIFVISVFNVAIAHFFPNSHESLPLMFAIVGLFSLVMFIGGLVLPESPRWLVLKGKYTNAKKVLHKVLVHDKDIQNELNDINQAIKSDKGRGIKIIFNGYFFKVLLLGVFLQVFQQLVGINVIIYYSPKIFGYANMHGLSATLIVPTVFMLFTFPSVVFVEKFGRKVMLYIGSILILGMMLLIGSVFLLIGNHPEISALLQIVLVGAVIIYLFGFAISWGPVVWLICSEIFPLEGREVGMTITTMVNWLFAGFVVDNALSFMHKYGSASLFFAFSGMCLLSLLFLKLFVPETKGISLENLEKNLKSGVSLRNIGSEY